MVNIKLKITLLSNILNNYLDISNSEDHKKQDSKQQIMEYNYRELLSNPLIHEEFIEDVNKRFKWKYYKTIEELKLDYDMFDYDNMNQIFVDYSSAQHTEVVLVQHHHHT